MQAQPITINVDDIQIFNIKKKQGTRGLPYIEGA